MGIWAPSLRVFGSAVHRSPQCLDTHPTCANPGLPLPSRGAESGQCGCKSTPRCVCSAHVSAVRIARAHDAPCLIRQLGLRLAHQARDKQARKLKGTAVPARLCLQACDQAYMCRAFAAALLLALVRSLVMLVSALPQAQAGLQNGQHTRTEHNAG